MKKFFNFLLEKLANLYQYIIGSFNKTSPELTLSKEEFHPNGKYLEITLKNKHLLGYKELASCVYNTIFNLESFKNFGDSKIMIISAYNDETEFNYHPNILINNSTTFENYYSAIKEFISDREYSYGASVVFVLTVRIWNVDNLKNRKIKVTKDAVNKISFNIVKRQYSTSARYTIKPLTRKFKEKSFATVDIETVEINGIQVPLLIGICSQEVKQFLLDKDLLKINLQDALNKLWLDFFNYLENSGISIVFAHNLGGFDGYFIYKGLLDINYPNVETVVDQHNNFILIKYGNIVFKDSYRIFPVSLNELCYNFGIKGKLSQYLDIFNQVNILEDINNLNKLIDYNAQDCSALFNALQKAQSSYYSLYSVDITTIVSTSSLALKIFRTKYQETNIPILKKSMDSFIRKSYFGGATDIYLNKVEDIKYFDVNSLYPFAMTQGMPLNPVKVDKVIDLDNFFGFVKVDVYCPSTVERPLLPTKYKGKTIFPTGMWSGTYFSEELKAIKKLIPEYEFITHEGYSCDKVDLFSNYVNTLYKVKSEAEGSERWIAKLLLNCLYGTFGRSNKTTSCIRADAKDLPYYMATQVVTSTIKISENTFILIVQNNTENNLLSDLNTYISSDFPMASSQTVVKSNVAIAAAITAYARIVMMPFKLDPSCAYSDTDSVFSKDILKLIKLGKELGLFKDELDGKVIKEAIFLDIKQYGYTYNDSGKLVEKSVFAGAARDSISFKDIERLQQGATLELDVKTRFFKSLANLTIKVKTVRNSISYKPSKKLVGNKYLPINIQETSNQNRGLNLLLRNISKLYKKILARAVLKGKIKNK